MIHFIGFKGENPPMRLRTSATLLQYQFAVRRISAPEMHSKVCFDAMHFF